MNIQEMTDRYYELRSLMFHDEYILDEEEMEEFNEICSYLLSKILEQNKDVLIRLKDR